jgi:hypothetical protein
MKTIKVKQGKNGPFFREGARRQIDENGRDMHVVGYMADVEVVPDTRYYRNAITSGDLVLVVDAAPVKPTKPLKDKE